MLLRSQISYGRAARAAEAAKAARTAKKAAKAAEAAKKAAEAAKAAKKAAKAAKAAKKAAKATEAAKAAESGEWSTNFVITPGEWPLVTSQAERKSNYVYGTLEQAKWRDTSRALIRTHEHEPRYRLVKLLKKYGLPRSGRRAALVARLTAHEATLLTPPFVAVTKTFDVFEFLRLPTEIRVMVYKELLTIRNVDYPHRARIDILSVNKQIYNEAKGFLYSLNTIEIKLDDWDRLWLGDSYRPFHVKHARLDEDLAPLNRWLNLPSYIGRCEKIKIVLSIQGSLWHLVVPEDTDKLLTNFNSLIYTKLIDHEHLRDIQLELQTSGEHNHYMASTVTDGQVRSFEQGCLNTFCHLRGIRAVSLKGFIFADPFDVFLAKHTVSLPSLRTWNSFPTIPKMIEAAPQWWQLRNLSIHCSPSGRYVATSQNRGNFTSIAFHKAACGSLTRGKQPRPQTQALRSYRMAMSQRHLTMLKSVLQKTPPTIPAQAPLTVKSRTLKFHEELVKIWKRA